MKSQFQPWQLLLLTVTGWINRRQQDAVECLLTENRILRDKLGKNRILLSEDQWRRLAIRGRAVFFEFILSNGIRTRNLMSDFVVYFRPLLLAISA
jgi:intracellular septation protein A